MYIIDTKLGDVVRFTNQDTLSLYNKTATVIGTGKECHSYIVGWKKDERYYNRSWIICLNLISKDKYNFIENIKEFERAYVLFCDCECEIVEQINIPNQICIGCKITAPHKKPNYNNNFICVSCKVEECL